MSNHRNDRGIAMLIALFALLLLSVIGLGMMYSTNMETSINSNYRDKQNSLYSASAGLQEARDRLRPYDPTQALPAGRIVAPQGLPSTTAQNIVYIINPKNGETVAPWDYQNAYADTELCHESILGLVSPGLGVQCTGSTSLPSVNTWYRTYDDSDASTAGFWKISNPLDFKWIRVQLKTNDNTPVIADGDPTNHRQVCWDGTRQLVLPTGYGPECIRFGSVIAITVTSPGSGFTSQPTVTIDPSPQDPTGALYRATATANIEVTNAVVGSITVNNQGSGYLAAPTVTLDPPTGSPPVQATAHVCTSSAECANPYIPPGAPVATVSVSSAGTTCYPSAPAVLFSGGDGIAPSGVTAPLASGSTSCVYAWSITGTCPGRSGSTVTGVGLTLAGASGFSGTIKFDSSGNVVTGYPTIQNSGTGFTSNPTINMPGPGSPCTGLTPSFTLGRRIASPQTITVNAGSGYTSAPTVSFATGAGSADTAPTATSTLGTESVNARKVRQIMIDNAGSGYLVAPNVTITPVNGGTGAMATAALSNSTYKVTSVTITDQGYGYTTDPNVQITGGGGTGATATSTLGRGANYGKIYLLTTLAQTVTGARTMMQMEVTTAISGFNMAAALVVDGPNPNVQHMPNSTNLYVNGNDAHTCDANEEIVKPAVGGYDDPTADPPTTSTEEIIDALPDDRLDNYVGEGANPSVRNVYESLGETLGTPTGLKSVLDAVNAHRTNVGNTVDFGTITAPAINYINGDATISGGTDGYGILAVTGTLVMNGNFSWHGVILVIGDGRLDFGGGGAGTIYGTVLVAKIYPSPGQHTDADLLAVNGSPTINWNGGGGNSILYDHCWATNIMAKVPIDAPISLRPLKVLSFRNLPY